MRRLIALTLVLLTTMALRPPALLAAQPSTSIGDIEGVVLDGRALEGSDRSSIVVPDDLAPVAGATVRLTDRQISTTSNEAGEFSFNNVPIAAPYSKVDIEVSAQGFGVWRLSGVAVRSGTQTQLHVELGTTGRSDLYTPSDEKDRSTEPEQVSPTSTTDSHTESLAVTASTACDDYSSNDFAPPKIRVYDVSDGNVTTYDFDFYIKHSLPQEWFTTWHLESWKAGAVAVRNFAWRWINTGGGGTFGGECYHVDDTTNFQEFDEAVSYSDMDAAVDATANWLVRCDTSGGAYCGGSGNMVFLAHHNAGAGSCGAEADGVHMNQNGTEACAVAGEQWRTIVARYYYPGVTFDYVPPLGAVVGGNFNGDAYRDVAIGAPGEDVGAQENAGVVHILLGSATGLIDAGNKTFQQGAGNIGGSAESGDRFGFALAADNFNGDSYTDLAVGVPGEGVGSIEGAGGVQIIPGSSTLSGSGSTFWAQDLGAIEGDGEEGDRYGHALAAGDFDADGRSDLAVGVPGEDVGGLTDSGLVNVLMGGASGITDSGDVNWDQDPLEGSPEARDLLGSALAVGNFNGASGRDLAIGVPGEAIGSADDAGLINVVYGSGSGLTATGNQDWYQSNDGLGGTAEAGDFFGAALSSADFSGDGKSDLAVGVPSEAIGAASDAGGVDVLYGGTSGLTSTGYDFWAQGTLDGTAETGDYFGWSLVAFDLGSTSVADLAVGVPLEDKDSTDDGVVNVIYGATTSGLITSANKFFSQAETGVPGDPELDDAFGAALAAGNFGKTSHGDLVVGVPLENIGSGGFDQGLVNGIYGTAAGLSGSGAQEWYQGLLTIGGTADDGDLFG
jgi:hypothetical protein